MAHAYCTGCKARVTVVDGRCLLDHRIDPSTVSTSSGRRTRTRRSDPSRTPATPSPAAIEPDLGSFESTLDSLELDLRVDPPTRASEPIPHDARSGERNGPRPAPEPAHSAVEPEPTKSAVALAERPARSEIAPTNSLVADLWAGLVDTDGPLQDWSPGTVDTDSRTVARRVFLSTIVVVAVAIVGAASWFLADRGDASLAARLDALDSARSELAATVDASSAAIEDLGDGAIDQPDELARSISEIDDGARTVFSAAAELPTDGDFADLRRQSITISDDALQLSRGLSRTSAYASSVGVMLNRPAFPFEVTDDELTTVAEETATWVTRFLSMSASLPAATGFEEHRDRVLEVADRLPEWQAGYLGALRSGDIDTAGGHLADLETWAADLQNTLGEALISASADFDGQRSTILEHLG